MTKKISLPEIISTRAQLNQLVNQRGFLMNAKKTLERNVTLEAGEFTEARMIAMDREIEEYTKRIKVYQCGWDLGRPPKDDNTTVRSEHLNAGDAPPGKESEQSKRNRYSETFKLESVREFGFHLVYSRVKRRLKRIELARRIGISNSQLGRHEKTLYVKASYELMIRVAQELAKF